MGLQNCLIKETHSWLFYCFQYPPLLHYFAVVMTYGEDDLWLGDLLYLGQKRLQEAKSCAMPCLCMPWCTFHNFGKHCIHSYNVFDFLREVVSKVPDYGSADAGGDMSKRRKVAGGEVHESDEDSKRGRMETSHGASNVRGRGRGRPRGRGRGPRFADPRHDTEVEPSTSEQSNRQIFAPARQAENISESLSENLNVVNETDPNVRSFDLNTGMDDDTADKTTTTPPASAVPAVTADAKGEEFVEISEVDRMVIDPRQVAQMNSQMDDDDEDYDEEG